MKTTLKTQPRQIRLPALLWKRLAEIATRLNKSRAELVRQVLTDYAERQQ